MLVLLVVEIVSTGYYRVLRRHVGDPPLADMCRLILRDESQAHRLPSRAPRGAPSRRAWGSCGGGSSGSLRKLARGFCGDGPRAIASGARRHAGRIVFPHAQRGRGLPRGTCAHRSLRAGQRARRLKSATLTWPHRSQLRRHRAEHLGTVFAIDTGLNHCPRIQLILHENYHLSIWKNRSAPSSARAGCPGKWWTRRCWITNYNVHRRYRSPRGRRCSSTPFYPKDAHASFGKHVLTPTLALTSFAGATPEHWKVEYWDENLLHGRPPFAPMPEVVGITVHLTFARRAFELARWYRERGSKVVLGGLHVVSCPEECAPHADALAIGDGVQFGPVSCVDIEAGKASASLPGDGREMNTAPTRRRIESC